MELGKTGGDRIFGRVLINCFVLDKLGFEMLLGQNPRGSGAGGCGGLVSRAVKDWVTNLGIIRTRMVFHFTASMSPGERVKNEVNHNTMSGPNPVSVLSPKPPYQASPMCCTCLAKCIHSPPGPNPPWTSCPFSSSPPSPLPLFSFTKAQIIEEVDIFLRKKDGGRVGRRAVSLAVGKLWLTKRRRKALGRTAVRTSRHTHTFWSTILLLHIHIHELSPEFSWKQETLCCVPREFDYSVNQIVGQNIFVG